MSQLMAEVYNLVTKPPAAGDQDKVPDEAKRGGRFSDSNTAVHLAMPGLALLEEDFNNMWTSSNPQGLKGQTASFSVLVDSIPTVGSSKYTQNAKRVSQAYEAVVNGANATGPEMSDGVKEMLVKMDKFLYEMKQEERSPFADESSPEPESIRVKTTAYKRYESMIDDIGEAADDIRKVAATASRKADWQAALSNDEITEIEADSERRQRLSDRALKAAEDYWDEFSSEPNRRYKKLKKEFNGDKELKWVGEALTYQSTHGNELSASLLANAKELVKQGDWTPVGASVPVKLAFPSSTKFADKKNQDGWTEMTISTKDYHKLEKTKHVKVEGSGGAGWGFWSAKASGGYEHNKNSTSVESKDMTVTMEVSLVNISRPWLDATIFSEYVQWNAGRDQPKGSVSSGTISNQTDNHFLPFIPMQMIVARNVKLYANWSKEDKEFVSNSSHSKTSGGWGPFSASVSHEHSDSRFEEDKHGRGAGLEFTGIQCLGFISWVPPFSAPADGGANDKEFVSAKVNEASANAAEAIIGNMNVSPEQRQDLSDLIKK